MNLAQLPRPGAPSSVVPARLLESPPRTGGPPIARWRLDDATRHWIRSHSPTLGSSRVIYAPPSHSKLVVLGSAPDHAALLHAFVPEERNSSEPRAPSHATGGASRRSRWPARGCERTRAALLREGSTRRSGADASRGCGPERTRTCAPGGFAPARRLPDTSLSPTGSAARRNNALRADGGPKSITFGAWRNLAARCCLGNPLREERDPCGARGAFCPSDRAPRVGHW